MPRPYPVISLFLSLFSAPLVKKKPKGAGEGKEGRSSLVVVDFDEEQPKTPKNNEKNMRVASSFFLAFFPFSLLLLESWQGGRRGRVVAGVVG